jgi:hypothetical protein
MTQSGHAPLVTTGCVLYDFNRGAWRKPRGAPMKMKSILAAAAIASALGFCANAVTPVRAATVFDLTGTFQDGATISGTLTIDTATGHVDAISVSFLGVTYTSILLQESFTGNTAAGQTPNPVAYHVAFGTFAFPLIDPYIRGTSAPDSLVGYTGGPLCSVTTPCGPDQEGFFWLGTYRPTPFQNIGFQTGQLTAETPLPAALPLFATGFGVLGLLGWRRKRKAQAAA